MQIKQNDEAILLINKLDDVGEYKMRLASEHVKLSKIHPKLLDFFLKYKNE